MLDKANEGYKILLSQKDAYIQQVKKQTEEARQALKGLEAAKWKSDLASAFQSFEVGDVNQTQDEMLDRIRQKTAEGEGKLASAVDGMNMKDIENDKKAQQFEAQEILNQFKLDNPEFAAKLPSATESVVE